MATRIRMPQIQTSPIAMVIYIAKKTRLPTPSTATRLADGALVDGGILGIRFRKEMAMVRRLHRVGQDMGATKTLAGGEELNPTSPGTATAEAGIGEADLTALVQYMRSPPAEVAKAWKRFCNTYSPNGSSWEAMNVFQYRLP
jgi:hypothetical protein